MYITESQKPKARLSLSLTARLVNGTIKIFRCQTIILQGKIYFDTLTIEIIFFYFTEQLTFWLVIPRTIYR